jgi:molybdate transport repressor ModE-like protein
LQLKVRTKIWIECDGKMALSGRRVQLLEAIDELGSIQAASRKLGWPYRRAWGKIRELEQTLGVSLLATVVGGHGGGNARLTEAAREYIRRYHLFADGLDDLIRERFERAFG